MEWLKQPANVNNGIQPRDRCILYTCWTRKGDGGGPCIGKVCVTKFCKWNW